MKDDWSTLAPTGYGGFIGMTRHGSVTRRCLWTAGYQCLTENHPREGTQTRPLEDAETIWRKLKSMEWSDQNRYGAPQQNLDERAYQEQTRSSADTPRRWGEEGLRRSREDGENGFRDGLKFADTLKLKMAGFGEKQARKKERHQQKTKASGRSHLKNALQHHMLGDLDSAESEYRKAMQVGYYN